MQKTTSHVAIFEIENSNNTFQVIFERRPAVYRIKLITSYNKLQIVVPLKLRSELISSSPYLTSILEIVLSGKMIFGNNEVSSSIRLLLLNLWIQKKIQFDAKFIDSFQKIFSIYSTTKSLEYSSPRSISLCYSNIIFSYHNLLDFPLLLFADQDKSTLLKLNKKGDSEMEELAILDEIFSSNKHLFKKDVIFYFVQCIHRDVYLEFLFKFYEDIICNYEDAHKMLGVFFWYDINTKRIFLKINKSKLVGNQADVYLSILDELLWVTTNSRIEKFSPVELNLIQTKYLMNDSFSEDIETLFLDFLSEVKILGNERMMKYDFCRILFTYLQTEFSKADILPSTLIDFAIEFCIVESEKVDKAREISSLHNYISRISQLAEKEHAYSKIFLKNEKTRFDTYFYESTLRLCNKIRAISLKTENDHVIHSYLWRSYFPSQISETDIPKYVRILSMVRRISSFFAITTRERLAIFIEVKELLAEPT